MAGGWFEIGRRGAAAREEAACRSRVYTALCAGSEHGLTLEDNVAAFGELGFAPHVAGLAAERDLSTTVMGQPSRCRC